MQLQRLFPRGAPSRAGHQPIAEATGKFHLQNAAGRLDASVQPQALARSDPRPRLRGHERHRRSNASSAVLIGPRRLLFETAERSECGMRFVRRTIGVARVLD
jgi:hypothetical protein